MSSKTDFEVSSNIGGFEQGGQGGHDDFQEAGSGSSKKRKSLDRNGQLPSADTCMVSSETSMYNEFEDDRGMAAEYENGNEDGKGSCGSVNGADDDTSPGDESVCESVAPITGNSAFEERDCSSYQH